VPTYNIEVVIDPAQGVANVKKIRGALEQTGTAADRVGALVKRALAFTGVAIGIRELKSLADTYTNIQNRLRGVTNGTAQLGAVTQQLFEIANKTRGQYEASAELFTRVALATKELGRTQAETLQFTESLNKAVVLSGASSIEAEAGIIQLSQGLASGALRGDELRSVLEQLPAVADVIAKSLGVTRGELRNLGADGKITADIILDAFAKAREELDQRFAKTLPTVGQALTVFRNQVLRTFGDLDQRLGASASVAKIILVLANNIDVLARAAAAAGITIATVFVAKGVNSAIAGVRTLTLAIAANPIGAIAVAVTAAVAALVAFSDQIFIGVDGVTTLRDYGVAAFQLIQQYAAPVVQLIRDALVAAVGKARQGLASFGLTFGDVLDAAKTAINSYIGLYYGLYKAGQVVFTRLKELILKAVGSETAQTIVENFKLVIGFLTEQFQNFFQLILRGLRAVGVATDELARAVGAEFHLPELKVPDSIKEFGAEVKDAFVDGFNRDFVGDFVKVASPAFKALQDKARDVAAERLRNEAADRARINVAKEQLAVAGPARPKGVDANLAKIVEELRKEGDALRLTSSEREIAEGLIKAEKTLKRDLTATERALVEQQLRSNQALQAQSDALQSINGPLDEFKTTQQALNGLLQQGAISAAQYSQAVSQTQLAQGLQGVRAELPGQQNDAELQALQQAQDARSEILRQAMEARLITEQDYLELSREANKKYNQDVADYESARFQTQLQQGRTIFASLTSIAQSYAGEQSGLYKTLFRVSKAFAIAESTVKIVQGIADAAANPYPYNLAAMASVAAATAGLVGQIQSTNLQGFENGGQFRVGGSGGPDSQLVAFRATPNETVSVRTPGQDRAAGAQKAEAPQVKLTVVNVSDDMSAKEYLDSPDSDQAFLNKLNRNKDAVQKVVSQ
jgi:tape measure domain-containing protein